MTNRAAKKEVLCLSFDDYMELLDNVVPKEKLNSIKKKYIEKGYKDESFEVQYGLPLTEEEQEEVDNFPNICYLKIKVEEDEALKEFTHLITYNGSSAFALWICGIMD
jgi:hypothetical protein